MELHESLFVKVATPTDITTVRHDARTTSHQTTQNTGKVIELVRIFQLNPVMLYTEFIGF